MGCPPYFRKQFDHFYDKNVVDLLSVDLFISDVNLCASMRRNVKRRNVIISSDFFSVCTQHCLSSLSPISISVITVIHTLLPTDIPCGSPSSWNSWHYRGVKHTTECNTQEFGSGSGVQLFKHRFSGS